MVVKAIRVELALNFTIEQCALLCRLFGVTANGLSALGVTFLETNTETLMPGAPPSHDFVSPAFVNVQQGQTLLAQDVLTAEFIILMHFLLVAFNKLTPPPNLCVSLPLPSDEFLRHVQREQNPVFPLECIWRTFFKCSHGIYKTHTYISVRDRASFYLNKCKEDFSTSLPEAISAFMEKPTAVAAMMTFLAQGLKRVVFPATGQNNTEKGKRLRSSDVTDYNTAMIERFKTQLPAMKAMTNNFQLKTLYCPVVAAAAAAAVVAAEETVDVAVPVFFSGM